MISFTEAQHEILRAVQQEEPRAVPLADAVGLATAADLFADEPVPPFANSAVDGIALRAEDIQEASAASPVNLTVVGEIPAGSMPEMELGVQQTARIMTGAPLPKGADAVLATEDVIADANNEVRVQKSVNVGNSVRSIGEDIEAGQLVVSRGTVLGPAHIGMLASLGFRKVPAYPRLRVGVLSTGSEVTEGSNALIAGEIRDANRPMLLALVDEIGCEAFDLGIVQDDEDAISKTLEDAADRFDAVVTSGGASTGRYDLVASVLEKLGDAHAWNVAIRPARPLAFGIVNSTPVFGLPGNPVSSMVSFELFARPALLHMMGHPKRFRPEVNAVAEETMARQPDGRTHFDRVRLRYDGSRFFANRSGAQLSNVLSALAAANGLALLADGDGIRAGEEVKVMRLDCPCDH